MTSIPIPRSVWRTVALPSQVGAGPAGSRLFGRDRGRVAHCAEAVFKAKKASDSPAASGRIISSITFCFLHHEESATLYAQAVTL